MQKLLFLCDGKNFPVPRFIGSGYDSVTTSKELAAKGFDYVITIRVLNINENNHWLTDNYNYTIQATCTVASTCIIKCMAYTRALLIWAVA